MTLQPSVFTIFPLLDNVELSTDGNEANRSDILCELVICKKEVNIRRSSHRYSDGVTRTKMAAQKFKLEGTDSALELDFEKISYESTNVTRSQI